MTRASPDTRPAPTRPRSARPAPQTDRPGSIAGEGSPPAPALIDSRGPTNGPWFWAAGSADRFGALLVAFEFHISKAARVRYEFDRALFQTTGNVIIPDFPAARAFAKRMNERADADRYPDRVVHAAELNAMGLIDEILHHAIEIYRRTVNPRVMADAVAALLAQVQPEVLDHALAHFVEQFPPLIVVRGEQTPLQYLAGETEGIFNREIALEELLMLWLANVNPAFGTFDELFDDADLTEKTAYDELIAGL